MRRAVLTPRVPSGGSRRFALVAALVVVAASAAVPLLKTFAVNPDQWLVDLAVYREAGRSVLLGRGVYGWLTPAPQLLPFTYPPLAAVLAAPLAFLPFRAVGVLWTIAQLGILAVLITTCFQPLFARFRMYRPLAVGGAVALILWLIPIRDTLRYGQINLLLVAAVLADYLVARPRWRRGILIGLATAVKLTPGVFIVHLLLTGRRREATTAAVTAVTATALAIVIIPGDSITFWTSAVFDSERLGSNAYVANQSLRGAVLRTGPHGTAGSLLWVILELVIAVVGFRIAVRASRNDHELTAVAAVGLLAVLLSPVAWIHHLSWLIVVIGAVIGVGSQRRRVAVAVGIWLAYVVNVPWMGTALRRHLTAPDWVHGLGLALQSWDALVAVALLGVLAYVSRGGSPPVGGPEYRAGTLDGGQPQ
jgi:alpha-1,2-mannosyltransferase